MSPPHPQSLAHAEMAKLITRSSAQIHNGDAAG